MARNPIIAGGGHSIIPSVVPGNQGFPAVPHPYGPDPAKKFSSAECLQAIIDAIKADPQLIQNHINLVTAQAVDEFRKDFWPTVFDDTQWTRVSTHRPDKDAEGNQMSGTDLEIRVYENDYWMDNARTLSAEIHTEFGEVKEIKVMCSW